VDDLAHLTDTAHDGRHRIILHSPTRSICRRDSRSADTRANVTAFLNFSNDSIQKSLDRF